MLANNGNIDDDEACYPGGLPATMHSAARTGIPHFVPLYFITIITSLFGSASCIWQYLSRKEVTAWAVRYHEGVSHFMIYLLLFLHYSSHVKGLHLSESP